MTAGSARTAAGAPLARRPFRKDAKFMTTVAAPEAPGEGPLVYVKGAPEVVLERCSRTQSPDGVAGAIAPGWAWM